LVRLVEWLKVHELNDVHVEKNAARKDEENFFCLVTLAEQDVVVIEGEHLQPWNEINQEFVRFVFEKLNFVDNLAVSLLDNVGSQRWRKVQEE
jgi:hypothetical protein